VNGTNGKLTGGDSDNIEALEEILTQQGEMLTYVEAQPPFLPGSS
jgi:hypothetical protein